VPAFSEIALWKVEGHLPAVETGRKLPRWTSVLRGNNAYSAEFFADKDVRRFAVVTGVGEKLVKRLHIVRQGGCGSKFSVVWKRSSVGDGGNIEVTSSLTDGGELGIAAFLQSAALAVVGGGVPCVVSGGINRDTG